MYERRQEGIDAADDGEDYYENLSEEEDVCEAAVAERRIEG